jgi:hypothetical protein
MLPECPPSRGMIIGYAPLRVGHLRPPGERGVGVRESVRCRGVARRPGCLVVAVAAGLLAAACGSRNASLPGISQEAVEAENARQVAFRFETLIAASRRLQSVAFPVLTANAAYCGKRVKALFGLSVLTLENVPEPMRAAAQERLGLGNAVQIVQTAKNSPARRAGLAPGDKILRLGKRDIPEGIGGTEKVAEILAKAKPGRALRATVLRGTRNLTFPLRPVKGCAYPVLLAGLGDDEAIVRSGGIVVPAGLVSLAASDDELAIAVGHELGHLVAEHVKLRGDAGSLIGGFPSDKPVAASAADGDPRDPFSGDYEKVADYLGLYFAARAGFKVDGVEVFWRKVSGQDPRGLAFARTHPVSPERFILIGKTRDEIALKRQQQAPLEPGWKKN